MKGRNRVGCTDVHVQHGANIVFRIGSHFEAGGTNYDVYVRRTDGSPAVRIGEGVSGGFSPDGNSVIATTFTPPALWVLPTGVGEAKRFAIGIDQFQTAKFLTKDRIIVLGNSVGRPVRPYVLNLNDGKARAITPEGSVNKSDFSDSGTPLLISPDGGRMIIKDAVGSTLYSTAGEKISSIQGVESDDQLLQWASDGKTIFISRDEVSKSRIFKLDLATGRRTFFREIVAADSAGLTGTLRAVITPDGSSYAYGSFRMLSDLYLVEGLK